MKRLLTLSDRFCRFINALSLPKYISEQVDGIQCCDVKQIDSCRNIEGETRDEKISFWLALTAPKDKPTCSFIRIWLFSGKMLKSSIGVCSSGFLTQKMHLFSGTLVIYFFQRIFIISSQPFELEQFRSIAGDLSIHSSMKLHLQTDIHMLICCFARVTATISNIYVSSFMYHIMSDTCRTFSTAERSFVMEINIS